MQISLIVFCCYLVHSSVYNPVKSNELPQLSLRGNQLLVGGKAQALVGNSLFFSNNNWGGEKFFNENVVHWLKFDWRSTIIRAPLGVETSGGYLEDPEGNKARVKTVINAAIKYGMYVVVDWHASSCQYLEKATEFFKDIATDYAHVNNVIYELVNEPKDEKWKEIIKPYALALIKVIRAIDKNNLIVVGTRNWCQEVEEAAADPITGYINIAYSLHFYAAGHHQELRDKAERALKTNRITLFVTEYGTVNYNGDGGVDKKETDAWVKFMKDHKLSNANWAINDKQEGASALKPGANVNGGWTDKDLTESGQLVRHIIQTWSH